MPLDEAKNLLWRRETGNEGSDRVYTESSSSNAVIIRAEPGFCGLDHVLYADFNQTGKLATPDPRKLAEAAIESVAKAPAGKDGISYLMDLIKADVITALTPRYQEEVLTSPIHPA